MPVQTDNNGKADQREYTVVCCVLIIKMISAAFTEHVNTVKYTLITLKCLSDTQEYETSALNLNRNTVCMLSYLILVLHHVKYFGTADIQTVGHSRWRLCSY